MNLFQFVKILSCVQAFSKMSFNSNHGLKAYNQDGDLSGDYQLSGLWKFEIQSMDVYRELKHPPQIAWSGDIWCSPKRQSILFETFYVNLEPSGSTFSSPSKPGLSKFRGKWSCKGNEITLTRFKYGFSEIESYIGIYSPLNNGTIYGIFTFGANRTLLCWHI